MAVVELDPQLAQQLLEHCTVQAAERFGKPVCVAVCDAHGFLVAFSLADGAPVRTIALSQQKAYTSTRIGRPQLSGDCAGSDDRGRRLGDRDGGAHSDADRVGLQARAELGRRTESYARQRGRTSRTRQSAGRCQPGLSSERKGEERCRVYR
ncbi:heme-binding protein [Paraburkholderia sp. RL18-103-BIB-C]|uniref:GlcG/HbpS family heme-binding protein n=1 Tax=Paraburkholderia sp. RL18-103-BIB-C TaxID=3031637 RepID=UPI0038B83A1A